MLTGQTVSALGSFFLAMVLNPEIQRRAQAEIDRVLDNERLPTFADFSSLPYMDAIVMESLRWNPVVPLGAYDITFLACAVLYHFDRCTP